VHCCFRYIVDNTDARLLVDSGVLTSGLGLARSLNLIMKHDITLIEAKLAAFLPCTTATITAWYSRFWRAPRQRLETLLWAGIIMAGLYVLIWKAAPFYAVRSRWSLPNGVQFWVNWAMLFAGLMSGYRAHYRVCTCLNGHWLAWCLSRRQTLCEKFVRGAWLADVKIAQLVLIFSVLSLFIEMHARDILVSVELFFAGFICVFCILHFYPPPALSGRSDKRVLTKAIPAAVFIQVKNQRLILACCALIFVAVGMISACAVRFGRADILVFPALIALIGFAFIQSLMAPGAAALHGLLAWTGVSGWKETGNLLLMPVGIAIFLVCPILLSALMLDDKVWMAISIMGVAGAGYVTLVWIVHDLVRMQYGSGSAFVLLHMGIPMISWLLLGPAAILVICVHLGWLLRRIRLLWRHQP